MWKQNLIFIVFIIQAKIAFVILRLSLIHIYIYIVYKV